MSPHPLSNLIASTRRGWMALAAGAVAAACAPAREEDPPRPTVAATGNEGCWTGMPPLPFAVQEIYPAVYRGRIHVAGGLLGENGEVVGASDRHVAWTPEGAETLAPLPWVRHHPQLVAHGTRLFLLGGFGARSSSVAWQMARETIVYGEADRWETMASSPSPHAECVGASIGDRIHLVGGRVPRGEANGAYGDHVDSTQHLVFDPGANTWSKAAPALVARNSAAGGLIDGLWHVAGGRSMSGGPTDVHEVYDPREDKWRKAAPMPKGSGAGGNAAAVLGGALIVVGGEVFGSRRKPGFVHKEVWRYDPATDAWTGLAPMPTPRHGLGAVMLNDAIYTLGGATEPSGVGTSNVVERFMPGGCTT